MGQVGMRELGNSRSGVPLCVEMLGGSQRVLSESCEATLVESCVAGFSGKAWSRGGLPNRSTRGTQHYQHPPNSFSLPHTNHTESISCSP